VELAAAAVDPAPGRAGRADRKIGRIESDDAGLCARVIFCKGRFPARILIAKPESTFTEYALHFVAWRATTRA
jgi:hypothetical protein